MEDISSRSSAIIVNSALPGLELPRAPHRSEVFVGPLLPPGAFPRQKVRGHKDKHMWVSQERIPNHRKLLTLSIIDTSQAASAASALAPVWGCGRRGL